MHICLYVCTYVCICMFVCMHVCVYTHVCVHVCVCNRSDLSIYRALAAALIASTHSTFSKTFNFFPLNHLQGFEGCYKGEVCENQDVQCGTEPCYPVPYCIEGKAAIMILVYFDFMVLSTSFKVELCGCSICRCL